jgi:peroxin-16
MSPMQQVRKQLPAGMFQPAKLAGLYEEFVTKNAGSVGQVESALRSLTYIIPGKSGKPNTDRLE